MRSEWRLCPSCGAALADSVVRFDGIFDCPKCATKLRVGQSGQRARTILVYVASPLLVYAVGMRGLSLIVASLLALWPLGIATRRIVNTLFPPKIFVRPNDDPETLRCVKCGVELGNQKTIGKPFACPACGESLKIVMGPGLRFMMATILLFFFLGTPLAALIGYGFGVRGIDLALLPLVVFLGGAAVINLVTAIAKSRLRFRKVEAAPPDSQMPPSGFRETLHRLRRTELKLSTWKRD